jgi:hypothetical protein
MQWSIILQLRADSPGQFRSGAWALVLGLTLAVLPGCSKPAEQTEGAPETQLSSAATASGSSFDPKRESDLVSGPPVPVSAEVQAQLDSLRALADKVPNGTPSSPGALNAKKDSLITLARQLVVQSRWSDAVKVINEVSAMKLTEQQKAAVDGLKQQAKNFVPEKAFGPAPGSESNRAFGFPKAR